jgi:hypothetical protein
VVTIALGLKMQNQTRVVHCKRSTYDIYIGRPSDWGNPFVIGNDGDRATVIEKYRQWLLTQPELYARIHELRGKTLGCWCKPAACHGDILVELLERKDSNVEVISKEKIVKAG